MYGRWIVLDAKSRFTYGKSDLCQNIMTKFVVKVNESQLIRLIHVLF